MYVRCVLLGDAIHTVKPYFGLGANSASNVEIEWGTPALRCRMCLWTIEKSSRTNERTNERRAVRLQKTPR